jgi:hypothetical protein
LGEPTERVCATDLLNTPLQQSQLLLHPAKLPLRTCGSEEQIHLVGRGHSAKALGGAVAAILPAP